MKPSKKIDQDAFLKILATKYREDPVFFMEHALGAYTWSKMREILYSVRDNPKTAVRACHGSSKTYTGAGSAVWFFNIFWDSRVITTAPTNNQVELLLWPEINRMYRDSRFPLTGECQKTFIKSKEAEHYAVGFSTDKPARAEGFHAPSLFFIFDEAKGIAQWMWDAADGAMGGGNSRMLVLSTTDGICAGEKYHSIFTNPRVGKNWNCIHIDDRDLPSFTGEKFRTRDFKTGAIIEKSFEELKIQISTPGWEAERRDEWGEDSVLYLTKCRGEIVDKTDDCIIPLSDCMRMFENYSDKNFDDNGSLQVGVDVARFGSDSSEFYMRRGLKVIKHESYNKRDTQYLCDRLENFVDGKILTNELIIKVDDTGIGGAVTDGMRRRGYQNIVPVNFNQVAINQNRYPNAISEMWFETAKLVKQIACPSDESLKAQLVNRKMNIDKKGRRMVEPKKDYKDRLGAKSPDKADAFLLTFYDPRRNNIVGAGLPYNPKQI